MEIFLTTLLLLAVPVGMIIYASVRAPYPQEQYEAMLRDPKLRARALQFFRPRSRARVPAPPPAVPVITDDRSEEQLLGELRGDPTDAATRMVYADLLEQRGDFVKASLLRGERVDRAAMMLATDIAWRAVVSTALVPQHQCETVRWSELHPIAGDPWVRECPYCTQPVRYCNTDADRRIARARDQLAIVDSEVRP